jgi:hypothetical protein
VYAAPWGLSYAADGSPQFKMMFVPGVLETNGEESLVMLLFDVATGEAPVFAIFDPMSDRWTTQSAAELQGERPVFRPIVPTYDQLGNANVVRLGAISVGATGLQVDLATMNPGTYRMNLIAKDLWSNASLYPFDLALGGSTVASPTTTSTTSASVTSPRRPQRVAWFDRMVAAERAGSVTLALSSQQPATRARLMPRVKRNVLATLR